MSVEVYGFIVTQFPYGVHQIANIDLPEMRSLILSLKEGDILNIQGLGLLMVVSFDVKGKSHRGNELRELYITTMPA